MPAVRWLALGAGAAIAAGVAFGTCICKRRLPAPPDPATIVADGGKWAVSRDGKRVVEYFVTGSCQRSARVVVIVAGALVTGKLIAELTRTSAEKRNVKVIALSLPGWGRGTIHRRLRFAEWAADDVEPVLEQEGVGRFVVAGCSLGSAGCMAIAHRGGPARILAMGLRAPCLPKVVTDASGLPEHRRHVADAALSDALPFGWLAHLVLRPLLRPALVGLFDWLLHGATSARCKADHPDEFDLISDDMRRATAHYGHTAMLANMRRSTVLDWGFDPRAIRVQKQVVWYAPDDTDCPPAHGKWLAEHFTSAASDPSDVRVRKLGGGHGHLGAAYFEWDAFLGELMAQCAAAAPKVAGIMRC